MMPSWNVKDTSCQAGEGADLNWWQLYLHATHLFSSFSYAMTIPDIKYKEGEYHPMPTLLGLVDRHQHLQVISSTLLNARDSGQTSISLSWYLKEEAEYIASTYEPNIDFGDFKSQWTRRIIEMARSLSIPMVSFLMDTDGSRLNEACFRRMIHHHGMLYYLLSYDATIATTQVQRHYPTTLPAA